jgi:hypothetical protein
MAEEKKQEVKVPEAPSVLPAGEVENWKKRYVAGYEDSKAHDSEAQESVHHGYALARSEPVARRAEADFAQPGGRPPEMEGAEARAEEG